MEALEVEDRQVGALARLDAADLAPEAEGARAVRRRHAQGAARGQRFSPAPDLLQKRGGAHLREHVEAVVAGRTVRAERDGDAALEHLRDGRDAGAEF